MVNVYSGNRVDIQEVISESAVIKLILVRDDMDSGSVTQLACYYEAT